MTDKEKIEAIKAYIGRETEGLMDTNGNFGYAEHEGAYHALSNLETFINSLNAESEMIEEAYVSFDTAILLKEKGFNNICRSYWHSHNHFDFEHTKEFVSAEDVYLLRPTQQMAMRWLREVHNLCIEPYRIQSVYLYTISKIWTGSKLYSDELQWTTYEKACEAAIKYSLEHLI